MWRSHEQPDVVQLAFEDAWIADASPEPGRPMTTKVERAAEPLRMLISKVATNLTVTSAEYHALYAPRVTSLGFRVDKDELSVRAAWALVAQWLVGYATGAFDARATLAEAEEWFLGGPVPLPRIAPHLRLEAATDGLSPSRASALLAYLLDPLSPGTRRQVLKRREDWPDRRSRKASGTYYTPADLARFMTQSISVSGARNCLDPACGSGVFLRAARSEGGAQVSVFGCDINPVAAEQCAFVLLATDSDESLGLSPWSRWHLHRLNLATVDSLLLLPGRSPSRAERRKRAHELDHTREGLYAGKVPPPADGQAPSRSLGDLFPDLAEGAETLLSNPPYVRLGHHPERHEIARLYASFNREPSPAADVSTPFVEHAWRLTTPEFGRACVVVPLSVSFNTAEQFRGLRRGMASQHGRWRCAFFDRAPDALFGDDVKTRNAVLVYDAAQPSGLETTPILRWTSRSRPEFFASIGYVALRDHAVDELIPKLGSDAEVRLYRAIRSLPGRLETSVASVDGVSAESAAGDDDPCAVYVAPTAYNWFNCARTLEGWHGPREFSSTAFTRLRLDDEKSADAVFALLSSRLSFWLWRVEGDAFHVPRRFLRRLPFSLDSVADTTTTELAALGSTLWKAVAEHPLVSVNKRKLTLAFCAQVEPELLNAVDEEVLRAFDLTLAATGVDLAAWYERMVIVDSSEARRVARLRLGGMQASA